MDMIRLDSQISKKKIAEKLGMSIDGVKYHMKRMTELGMIRYIGTSRKGYWEILK